MKFREFGVPGLKLFVPRRFTDARGFFSEIWIGSAVCIFKNRRSLRANWCALYAGRFLTSLWTFAKGPQVTGSMSRRGLMQRKERSYGCRPVSSTVFARLRRKPRFIIR